jgi:diguanylate cyclase (GGDEF)-like protein/PAS domain S-box-containing protein
VTPTPLAAIVFGVSVLAAVLGYYLLRARRRITATEDRFRALTALSSDWYWEQDTEFRFTRIDGPRTQSLAVATPSQMIGLTRWEIGGLDVTPEQWAAHRAQLERHESFRDFVIKRTAADGTVISQSISGDPMFDDDGRFTGYRGVGKDISVHVRAQEQIARLAYHDSLTGLPNRSLLYDRITQAVALAQRDRHSAAVLFLDLDHFKSINDSLGHDAGDLVLCECAQRMATRLREADTIGRLGGDEFIVLLPVVSELADAALVADKLRAAMREPFVVGDKEVTVGVSVGIAVAPTDGQDAETLIRSADAAMYQAKHANRLPKASGRQEESTH